MNPGATEEAGLTARSAVDALKSTPVILGILIFNIAWMAVVGWQSHEAGERWERTVERTIKYCVPTGTTPKEGAFKLQSSDDETRTVELGLPPLPYPDL